MNAIAIAFYRALGAGAGIGIMEILATIDDEPLWLVPFVTSIVLAMALPDSNPAQPRAIIGGHILSCAAGLVTLQLVSPGQYASAIAVGLSTLLMAGSRTLHPPASINAFLIATHNLPLAWTLKPVIVGALLLTGFALVWRKLERVLFLPGERAEAPSMWPHLLKRWQRPPD